MTILAHPASLARRHAALEAELQSELARPQPDFVRIKRLKQRKLWIKDRLGAQRNGHAPGRR